MFQMSTWSPERYISTTCKIVQIISELNGGLFVKFLAGLYCTSIHWNVFTHLHSCHSTTLSCEQPAASHYAISNKTVELSLVSQSSISKYSLTTLIATDLEVCLCLDITTTKTTVWESTGMRYLVCRGSRTNNSLSLKSTKSGEMWESDLVWSRTDMSICLCVCVCVLCIISSERIS